MKNDIIDINMKYNKGNGMNTQVNYAIGSPSIEMYIDSYNESQGNNNILCYYTENGYRYINKNLIPDLNSTWTGFYSINVYRNGMYLYKKNQWEGWWLSSPSARANDHVCNVCSNAYMALDGYIVNQWTLLGVCPVISLKNDTILELK